jgi:RluA family pseudouridine synthase
MAPLHVLHHDDDLLIVAKPAGIPSDTTRDPHRDTLVARVHAHHPDATLCHRLDRDTSGLVVFARSARARQAMSRAFRERTVEKRYLAIIESPPTTERWEHRDFLGVLPRARGARVDRMGAVTRGGKPAHTRFLHLGSHGGHALVLAQPQTGRRHQIRVHLADSAAPIVGDTLYGAQPTAERFWLHALSIVLPHPADGTALAVRCPLPEDWPAAFAALGAAALD